MVRHAKFRLCLGLLALLVDAASAALPYTPTRIFLPSNSDGGFLYVLQPSSPAAPSGQLLALPVSSTIDSGQLPYTTISNSLPFLSSGTSMPFTSLMDSNGTIFVYTGDCTKGAAAASLWKIQPDASSTNDDNTWTKQSLSYAGLDQSIGLTGSNFLAAGVPFSTTPGASAEPGVYIFGGMCPTPKGKAHAGTWISSAKYSNQVLSLSPLSPSDPTSSYDITTTWSPADLIQEAGFSMTALQPTFSNDSDGSQFQQQDFVVLGGHTQNAFISTSKVALFSLPQSNWTFLDVEPPTNLKTDLARSPATQDFTPRSGHTAVLTSDGNQIVILGGWVGDTNQAAEPQVVVLNIGNGYGGSGPWSWSAPNTTDIPFIDGEGLYGHGAVMLPGNVMMVVGGYKIPPVGTSKKRRALQVANTDHYFFNITSNAWMQTYTPSAVSESGSALAATSSTAMKVGIGIGVTLGIVALIAAAVIGWLYYRRLEARRELREKELDEHSDHARRLHYGSFRAGIDGRGGDMSAGGVWDGMKSGSHDAYPWAPAVGTEALKGTGARDAERSGLLLEIPSPTRGLRRNQSQRGVYHHHPPPRRNSMIHPIEERDEDEISNSDARMVRNTTGATFMEPGSELDPFRDPEPSGSATVRRKPIHPVPDVGKPSAAELQHRSTQPWIRETTPLDYSKHANGRISPDKSDRTSSTLSEQSTRSFISTISAISARSARSFASSMSGSQPQSRNPFNSPDIFAVRDHPHHSNALHVDNTADAAAETSYASAMYSNENAALLGNDNEDAFPQRNGPRSSPTRVRSYKMAIVGGIVGSVRRAIPNALRSASMTSAIAPPRTQPAGAISNSERHAVNGKKPGVGLENRALPPVPRRTASDGAATGVFWDRKRGAKDWDYDPALLSHEERRRREVEDWNSPPAEGTEYGAAATTARYVRKEPDDNEDWDVEHAVQSRSVQVMFTVPREKLRVVNAEVASVVSDGDAGDERERGGGGGGGGTAVLRTSEAAGQVDESVQNGMGVLERVQELEEMLEVKLKDD